jgi:biopolymer transport protein ExbD
MSKKKSFVRRGGQSGEMSLNITAMADIFVVILVFLLKGFSSGAMNITPTAGLTLPMAFAEEQSVEALKLEISEGAVAVEGQPVTQLVNFDFEKAERQPNGTLKSLSAKLETERKRQLLIAQGNADEKVDARIVVIADQRVPYATLKAVLASAAVHGYTDFKLAVAKGD